MSSDHEPLPTPLRPEIEEMRRRYLDGTLDLTVDLDDPNLDELLAELFPAVTQQPVRRRSTAG